MNTPSDYKAVATLHRSIKNGVGDRIYHAADTTSGKRVNDLVDDILAFLYSEGFRLVEPLKK